MEAGESANLSASASAAPVPNERIVGEVPFPNPALFFAADGTPDYPVFYRERYEYMAAHFFAPANDAEIRQLQDIQFGDAVTAMLWISRFEVAQKYPDRAHDLFGMLIGYADGNTAMSHDCFGFYPVLKSALLLKAAGRFDPAWEPALERFTREGVRNLDRRSQFTDNNQDLARMYACLLARKLYPKMPEAALAAANAQDSFNRILKQGDLYNDSLNYFEVSLTFFIQIAHELGKEQEIARSPTFKRMFANYRDAISPNGFMPEFGHGYFSPNHYCCIPIFLEYAAALYHDPSFATAARRYFDMLVQSGPARDSNVEDAIHSCVHVMPQLLDLFTPVRGPLPEPDFISGVTRRIAQYGGEQPAFLILRPSLTPGAPMILMDLLGQGDHAQEEFRASVAYYESDHVPLFYQYGRYISGASRGNQVILGQPGDTEPDPAWAPDTWRTLSIPAARFTGTDGVAKIDMVTVRTDDRKKSAEHGFVLDNLRLAGPGGTKLVCDLPRATWMGDTHSVTGGMQPGSQAIRIASDGDGCAVKGFQPLTFDPEKYVELLCDVKWFGKTRPSAQLRLTGNGDVRSWTALEASTLLAVLKDARSERHGDDCWARLEYSSYGTFDSSLVRQIVLTREGVLAIRDDIQPGASADGRPAFSLWQMYSIDSKGPGRFSSRGECAYPTCVIGDTNRYRRGMSVYFSGPPGTAIGEQVIPGARLGNYSEIQRDRDLRTAYARLTIHAGRAAYLNLLVAPHAPDTDLSKLDAISVTTHDADHSIFSTECDGTPVTVEIGRNNTWKVTRGKQ